MNEEQHTMPIAVIPNQLQALHDELCKANRTIAELRVLLALSLIDMGESVDWCFCGRCQLKRDIKAVLSR